MPIKDENKSHSVVMIIKVRIKDLPCKGKTCFLFFLRKYIKSKGLEGIENLA